MKATTTKIYTIASKCTGVLPISDAASYPFNMNQGSSYRMDIYDTGGFGRHLTIKGTIQPLRMCDMVRYKSIQYNDEY